MTDAPPLVTIAIPTYNRASRFLSHAIRSACAQTYPNLDILVADNASTDETTELVRSFGDHRIRYHRHAQNLGSARNTNFCIDNSRGEYTLLLNDDDLIDPDLVSICMNAMTASGKRPGLIRTGTRIVDETGAVLRLHPNRVTGVQFENFLTDWIAGRTAPYLCSTLFLTRPLQEIGMHSRHYMWDDVLTELRLMARFGRLDIYDIHASFREHSAEITLSAAPRHWIEDSRQLLGVAMELSTSDLSSTRTELAAFLARLDYNRVAKMNASLWSRLRWSLYVWRIYRVLPSGIDWIRNLLSREAWYRRLKSLKWLGRPGRSPGR